MPSSTIDSALFMDLYGSAAMRRVFSDENLVQKWLDVEGALARAEAKAGLVPETAAREISARARVELMDFKELKRLIDETVHPIVPLIRCLSSVCEPEAAGYVHWGATTQDIMDTGAVLQLKEAHALISAELDRVARAMLNLAQQHRDTPMTGRTHGQQALPITFGYKVAVWLDELLRHRTRLQEIRERLCVGQFSGAVGTLASVGEKGLAVQADMLADLGLGVPHIAWHAARDRIAELVTTLALIAATAHKVANEVVVLQKSEFSELEEPFHHGKVGSSTMPHKRNPMVSEMICTLGVLVRDTVASSLTSMLHDHERDMRVWPLEWDYLPRVCIFAHAMLAQLAFVLEGLVVHVERMRKNMDLLNGLMLSESVMMYLAEVMGRQEAHELLYERCIEAHETNTPLLQLLLRTPEVAERVSAEKLAELLDPERYTGLSAVFVDRVVAAARSELGAAAAGSR